MSQISPLQLEHSVLTEFHLEVVKLQEMPLRMGYPSFKEAKFSTESVFERLSKDDIPEDAEPVPHYGVQLTVWISPKDEDNPQFPYKAKVSIHGIFATTLPEESRDALVLVNGSSLLYSAVREQLLMASGRFAGPGLMLPTVQFADLAKKMQEGSKEQPKSEAGDKGSAGV